MRCLRAGQLGVVLVLFLAAGACADNPPDTATVGGVLEVGLTRASPAMQRHVATTCHLRLQQHLSPRLADYDDPGGAAGDTKLACVRRQPGVSSAGFPR